MTAPSRYLRVLRALDLNDRDSGLSLPKVMALAVITVALLVAYRASAFTWPTVVVIALGLFALFGREMWRQGVIVFGEGIVKLLAARSGA